MSSLEIHVIGGNTVFLQAYLAKCNYFLFFCSDLSVLLKLFQIMHLKHKDHVNTFKNV